MSDSYCLAVTVELFSSYTDLKLLHSGKPSREALLKQHSPQNSNQAVWSHMCGLMKLTFPHCSSVLGIALFSGMRFTLSNNVSKLTHYRRV